METVVAAQGMALAEADGDLTRAVRGSGVALEGAEAVRSDGEGSSNKET
jgi:hypothetical protein